MKCGHTDKKPSDSTHSCASEGDEKVHVHDSGCGHHGHSHDHSHYHSHDGPESYNHGILKKIFSKAGAAFLERHRSKLVLGAAAALAAIEYKTTGTTSVSGALGMVFGATMVAHDASEDLMEAAGKLNETHNISSGIVGMSVGAAHTVSEGLLTVSSKVSGYEDMAVATTMGSNVSHIPLMAGLAGVIGAVSIDKPYAYKMNSVFMGGVTGAFAYQILSGDFNPWMSAGTIGAGAAYLAWRVSAGQTCAVHGDACGSHNHGSKNETDYISLSYFKDTTNKIKNITIDGAASRLSDSIKGAKEKLSNISMPSTDRIKSKLNTAWKAVSHENIVTLATSLGALGVSAHVLGDNVIKLAEQGGISATATGATVAALAFALPELILTAKAALKKDGEMAWGAVTGCTVATVGIVGGLQGLGDFDVPASLNWATTEGKVQMGAFIGSAGAIIAATHPKVAGKLTKIDNAAADLLENKFKRVSDWLRNDGTKLSKIAAAPMLASAIAFYALNTQPNCHWHGNSDVPHCVGKTAPSDQEPLLFEP
jgi:Ca2+/Na+ antiporter